MAQAASKRYGKGPSIGPDSKGDEDRSGNMAAASAEAKKTASAEKAPKEGSKRVGGNEPGPAASDASGTLGVKVNNEAGAEEVHHAHERMMAHASRMHDHQQMHARHEHEHMMRGRGMHHETHEAMAERHHREMREMHTAHEAEHKRMSMRHMGGAEMADEAGMAKAA